MNGFFGFFPFSARIFRLLIVALFIAIVPSQTWAQNVPETVGPQLVEPLLETPPVIEKSPATQPKPSLSTSQPLKSEDTSNTTGQQPKPVTSPDVPIEPSVPGVPIVPVKDASVPAASVSTTSIPSSTLPHNLSPLGMFLAADVVVKSVLIGLAVASVVSWTIWLFKTLELGCARFRAHKALTIIRSAKTLEEAYDNLAKRRGPAAVMVLEAKREVELSHIAVIHAGGAGLKERVSINLSRIEVGAVRRISKGTGLLATIGSTAPFIGLFGTVWGIMNAFIGISEAKTTNLAVVAPGIAEALLATATGLVAAIPAVIIYNMFARSIAGYRLKLGDAAAGVEQLVSRDIDYHQVTASGHVENAPDILVSQ